MMFSLTREDQRIVVKIVAFYSLFGGLWIYLSDSALGLLVRDPDIITRIATYKGLLFITVTAVLLYYLIGRYISRLSESGRQIAASEDELRSLLELMPVGVSWADNKGAIKYINHSALQSGFRVRRPPSAVILDLTIPGGMGGEEAARAILAIDRHAQLIVSSGYSNDPIISEFGNYGFAASVHKPYSLARIAEILDSLLKVGMKTGK